MGWLQASLGWIQYSTGPVWHEYPMFDIPQTTDISKGKSQACVFGKWE